ncbi:MAG: hypothetical protein IKQ51_04580 [Bacteroidaceae bacterium]|nr:hypothetical protein [Bacteroidaceae bacterium]
MKEEKTIRQLLEMLDNPETYTEQEIRDIINHDEETREAYRLMVEAKRSSRHTHANNLTNVDAAWKRFNQKHKAKKQRSSWMKIAASFIIVLLITGVSFAAYRAATIPKQVEETKVDKKYANKKMLHAYRLPKDAPKWQKERLSDAIWVSWCKGTWVVNGDDSFVEEHPFCDISYLFFVKNSTVILDGKVLDINNLPDLPASALKKITIHYNKDGHGTAHLSTKPVQIPVNVKGNINPELTILLTGTVPKGAYQPVTIWECKGLKDSYDWHDYTYTSWTAESDNISMKLKEVAIRKDHRVRVNICKGTPQKHIDRIKKLMQENGVTNYELVNQK